MDYMEIEHITTEKMVHDMIKIDTTGIDTTRIDLI